MGKFPPFLKDFIQRFPGWGTLAKLFFLLKKIHLPHTTSTLAAQIISKRIK